MRRAMDRRDFLLLRSRGTERVLDLSCERLYMQWADARSGAGALEDPAAPDDWMEGEPPTDIRTVSPAELFEELDRALVDADVLRVLDREWLSDAVFASEVTRRIATFEAGGGRLA